MLPPTGASTWKLWKVIVVLVVVITVELAAAAVVAVAWLNREAGSALASPVAVDVRVDPTLDRTDGEHPGNRWDEKSDRPVVWLRREKDGSMFLAAHRSSGTTRVERVELTIVLDPPGPRAEAAARWYKRRSIPFFTGNENATDLHGVVVVDAARSPSAGDDRIIAYRLDGLRDGKPVHFSGKVIVDAGEPDTRIAR